MENRKKNTGKVQIIWRHSTVLLKVLVVILIVFSMAALAALGWVRAGIRNHTDEMRAEASALEDRNELLNERIENIDSVQTIQDVAKEELGLVDPNSVMIQPQ